MSAHYAEICYSPDEGRYYAEIIRLPDGLTVATTRPRRQRAQTRADAEAALAKLDLYRERQPEGPAR